MTLYTKACIQREPTEKLTYQPQGDDYRSEFRKDYGRLLHSSCFRRLQGKTQLFPSLESDFFRNRLTHSLEVAQVAKGIAIFLNKSNQYFEGEKNQIDYDLVEFAGIAHDLGHPPFGHNGESALHEITYNNFGYEGNAQTLRILTTLEKRYRKRKYNEIPLSADGNEYRDGLNLTYRSLAAVLKYDREIPQKSQKKDPIKGYYGYNAKLVKNIKFKITGINDYSDPFKTIECYIMDIADDIAYSTYDFEDSLKAGFIHILDLLGASKDFLKRLADRVKKNVHKEGYIEEYDGEKIKLIYLNILRKILGIDKLLEPKLPNNEWPYILQVGDLYQKLKEIGEDGYLRTNLTSNLIHHFIGGIQIDYNNEFPALSKAYLGKAFREEVEVLKNFIFISQIESNRLKVSEYRGKDIVKEIYEAIHLKNNSQLMPDDYRNLYNHLKSRHPYRQRIVVDFIAGMTDRYAIEFYGRLKSENPQTIFKPL